MSGNGGWKAFSIVLGILSTISLGLVSWALLQIISIKSDTRIAIAMERQGQILAAIEGLKGDDKVDINQSHTLSKFWKLHSWERDQITVLRVQAGLDIEPWPDLAIEPHDTH